MTTPKSSPTTNRSIDGDYLVRVFFAIPTGHLTQSLQAKGTSARVICLNKPMTTTEKQSLAAQSQTPATCFISPAGKQSVQVDCFNPLQAIACCGHGLLASAAVWFSDTENNPHESLQIQQTYTQLSANCIADGPYNRVTVELPALAPAECNIPEWSATLFTEETIAAEIENAWHSGDDHGYLILRLQNSANLGRIAINTANLSANTDRALILTQYLQRKNQPLCRFRYFAPQYGADEDLATGSALRALAPLWRQLYQIESLLYEQLSASGGLLTAELLGSQVAISGNLSITGYIER